MMSLGEFISLANQYPWAYVAVLFDLGVVFMNGWTDVPNCIATCVTTRCMKPNRAIFMAAVGNLLGTLAAGFFAAILGDVSGTVAGIVNFSVLGVTPNQMFIALAFGLLANVIVSLICTKFGFPSSQSNALVGGLTGGAIALAVLNGSQNIFCAVGAASWVKVIIGFFGSIIVGLLLGYGLSWLIVLLCRKIHRGVTTRFFTRGQVVASGIMSLAHGLQDGAKFLGVFMVIAVMLKVAPGSANVAYVKSDFDAVTGVWWIVLPVALVIFGGTFMGGRSIIKTMGSGMAKLHKYQGFATDIAAGLGLIMATVFGLPISSGSIKATAIMGVGAQRNPRRVNWGKAGTMVLSWIAIFPGTIIIGFILTVIFASIFK